METFRRLAESDWVQKQGELFMYGIPTWFIAVIEMGLGFITLAFSGYLGKTMLAGVGLGNTISNVLLWSILWGFISVLDTYGPQVYASRNMHNLGTVTLKILLQGCVIFIFILGVYLNSVHIVSILPSDVDMTRGNISITQIHPESQSFEVLTIRYVRLVCLVPLLDFFIAALSRYLVIQQYIYRVYIYSAAMVLIHVLVNYVLVVLCDFALTGLAMSALITRVLTLILIGAMCWAERDNLAWSGYSAAVCSNWGETLKLGLSGAANVFVELGTFEAAVFLSKFDGTVAMATCVIFVQFVTIFYTFVSGLSTATTILIGRALQGKKTEVFSYIKIAVANAIVLSSVIALAIYSLKGVLVRFFTHDPAVIELFKNSAWVMLIQIIPDHMQTVLSRGVLNAFGKQSFIATALALICGFVAIPLMAVFVFFTNLGPVGILIALTVFAVINLLTAAVKISTLDIDKEIQLSDGRTTTVERSRSNSIEDDDFDDGDNESAPLTAQRRRLTGGEMKVLGWSVGGLVILVCLTYTSFL